MSYSPEHPDQSFIDLSGFRLDEEASAETDFATEAEPKSTWTSNPLIQLGAVGLVVGGISFGLYSLVSGIGPVADSDELPENQSSLEQAVEPEVLSDGHLKADLAFGRQSDDIAAIGDPSEATADSQPNKTASTTAPVRPTTAARSVVAQPVRHVPAPVAAPARPPQLTSMPVPPTPAPERSPAAAEPPLLSAEAPETTPEATIADNTVSPELATMTVISGTTAKAVLEQSAIANTDLPMKTRLRLTEPLKTTSGEIALPTGTLLIAEVASQNGQTAWLNVTAAVIEDAEYPLTDQAVLAMGLDGPWQRELPASQAAGIDFEQILLTGAIASLGLDRDDFLSGVALDILDQLNDQETADIRSRLEAQGAWVISPGTELIVHVNEALELPALASETTLSAPSDRAALLASLGPTSATTKTIALTTGHAEVFRVSAPDEPILHAWLSEPETVSLTFDQPLASGNARLIRAVMTEGNKAGLITLDVITAHPAGKNRWHRIVFEPDTSQ